MVTRDGFGLRLKDRLKSLSIEKVFEMGWAYYEIMTFCSPNDNTAEKKHQIEKESAAPLKFVSNWLPIERRKGETGKGRVGER